MCWHCLRAQNHELEQWILQWRLAFPRAVQNVSSGDIRKAPTELRVSSCPPPFPIPLIPPLLKKFTSGSHMKGNDVYFDYWASVWDWDSDWSLVGWTSALGLLWNRLIWYFSLLTTPKELKKWYNIIIFWSATIRSCQPDGIFFNRKKVLYMLVEWQYRRWWELSDFVWDPA